MAPIAIKRSADQQQTHQQGQQPLTLPPQLLPALPPLLSHAARIYTKKNTTQIANDWSADWQQMQRQGQRPLVLSQLVTSCHP
eukprot:1161865-Pelagomonas_calceolata.AAC.10